MKLNEEKPALTEGLITDYDDFLAHATMAYAIASQFGPRRGADSGYSWMTSIAKAFEAELIEKEFATDIDAIQSRRIRGVIVTHLRGLGPLADYLKAAITRVNGGSKTEAKIILAGLLSHLEQALLSLDQEDRQNQQLLQLRQSLNEEISAVMDLRSENVELQAQADKDPLTGLDRIHVLERKIKSKHREGHLFFLDFNGLGVINKVLGDRVGDMAILHAGNILAKVLRDEDLISRKGGDEFVGLYEGRNVDPEMASVRIIEGFRGKPMKLDLKELNISLEKARSYVNEWTQRKIGYCRAELNEETMTMDLYLSVAIGTRKFDLNQAFDAQVGYADQLMSLGKFKAKDRDETGTDDPKDLRLKAARDVYVVQGSEPVIFED